MKVLDRPFQMQTCLLLSDDDEVRFGASSNVGRSRQFEKR